MSDLRINPFENAPPRPPAPKSPPPPLDAADDFSDEELAVMLDAQRRLHRRDLAERILLALLSRRENYLPHLDCKLAVEYTDELLKALNENDEGGT